MVATHRFRLSADLLDSLQLLANMSRCSQQLTWASTNSYSQGSVPHCRCPCLMSVLIHLLQQVPCSFSGGVTVKVDQFRASDGGWVRLVFNTVNGGPLEKVELTKVRSGPLDVLDVALGAL